MQGNSVVIYTFMILIENLMVITKNNKKPYALSDIGNLWTNRHVHVFRLQRFRV